MQTTRASFVYSLVALFGAGGPGAVFSRGSVALADQSDSAQREIQSERATGAQCATLHALDPVIALEIQANPAAPAAPELERQLDEIAAQALGHGASLEADAGGDCSCSGPVGKSDAERWRHDASSLQLQHTRLQI